jgi:transcriptional regulator with XRE-family HTH domain
MKDHNPTVCARELGAGLRRARERAGHSMNELARLLEWSPSRVSRVESGRRGASATQIARFLGVCRVKGAETEELLGLCRDIHQRTWLRSHGALDHEGVHALIQEETTAATVSEYQPLAIPALLQTPDYARAAFLQTGLIPQDGIKPRVSIRINRRQALYGQPTFRFFVSEPALCRLIVDPAVMKDQLLHMVGISLRSNCTIRIVPVGELVVEPFRLMKYADYDPVAYVTTLTRSIFLEEPQDIAAYLAVLAQLDHIALDAEKSRAFLNDMAGEPDLLDESEPTTLNEHE